MNIWLTNVVLSFVIAALIAGLVIPKILLIAFRKNLFDEIDERKIHHGTVPRLGGLAFTPVIYFTLALLIGCNMVIGLPDILDRVSGNIIPLTFGFCALTLIYVTGIADDLIGIRYRAKFVIQIICAVMLVVGGLHLGNLDGFCGIYHIPMWLSYPLTVLIIVAIINAINLIDGIDGLASGLSSVALVFYGVWFYIIGHQFYSMISFATAGVLVPVFYYNVFGDPDRQKKIFMGDTGSLTIGLIICFLSLKLALFVPLTDPHLPNPLVLAFAPLIVPCFDVVRVYLYRIRHGRNPFVADRNHIHHKLLNAGLRQRTAMITIVLYSAAVTFANIALSPMVPITVLVVADILVWILPNMWLSRYIFRREARLKAHN